MWRLYLNVFIREKRYLSNQMVVCIIGLTDADVTEQLVFHDRDVNEN